MAGGHKAEELAREFLEAALRLSQFLRKNDADRANREYDRLHALKNKLRTLPDRGESILKRLVTSDDVHVKVSAAAALLAVDEAHAIDVLERIARSELGLVSFSAEMLIQEWRNGAVKDYWK